VNDGNLISAEEAARRFLRGEISYEMLKLCEAQRPHDWSAFTKPIEEVSRLRAGRARTAARLRGLRRKLKEARYAMEGYHDQIVRSGLVNARLRRERDALANAQLDRPNYRAARGASPAPPDPLLGQGRARRGRDGATEEETSG
jgi:hypothetical protein